MDFLGKASTFVRVVEAGSLSAAARSLGLSLAATSRQLRALEEELGATLLQRSARGQHLTTEGRRFLAHATRLVDEERAARASVRRQGDVTGDLVLAASVSLGLLRVVPALPALRATHPGLRIELRLEERAVDLVGEGVDVAVRGGLVLPDTTTLVAQPLATFRQVLVAAPSYLRSRSAPRDVASLAGHATVGGLRATPRWELLDGDTPRSVPVEIALRVSTLVGIREATIAGLGIARLPDFVVAEALAAGRLRVVLPRLSLPTITIHALYRVEARNHPRIAAVTAHLRATLPLPVAPGVDVTSRSARARPRARRAPSPR